MYQKNISNLASVSPYAYIAEGVVIKDYAVIHDNVHIGPNTIIGEYTVIGSPGEFKGNYEVKGSVRIGARNIIHSHVTIQSPYHNDETIVGDGNLIMSHCHIPHDAILGDNIVMSTGSYIGGVCKVEDYATLGLKSVVHQRLTIGKGSMLGMGAVVTKNVVPYHTVVGNPAKFLCVNQKGIERAKEDNPEKTQNDFIEKHEKTT